MSGERDGVRRAAPAKLNLALAVDRADEQGMHPICSWMVPITLHDDVRLRRLEGGGASRLVVAWGADAMRPTPIDWDASQDLAMRARGALEERVGEALPVEITIGKRIPTQSGLGGGSSDAAATLLGLRDLFDLDADDETLASIGHGLGSDVPFFLGDPPARAAIVRGLGERVERIERPRTEGDEILLIVPALSCSTGSVYRAFDEDPPEVFRSEEVEAMARSGVVEGARLFNDLAGAAMRVAARLREARDAASEAIGAPVHVTGSGAAMFAILSDRGEAERREAAARVGSALPDAATRLVAFEGDATGRP